MNTEQAGWVVACCSTVAALVLAWLGRRAEARYRKADVRIDELGHDLLALAQQEHDKRAASEEARCRQIDALQKKLGAAEASRIDDIGLHRRGLAELLRLMQAVISKAERLADGENLEDRI